ncbi:MAG: hypothetical protein H6733_05195 [Alphaproteobacteria bacterium]|nr:hypothetical protein [Alphaproteobacteria bacterium]
MSRWILPLLSACVWAAPASAAPVLFDFDDLACTGTGHTANGAQVHDEWSLIAFELASGFSLNFWTVCDAHPDYAGSPDAGGLGVVMHPVSGGPLDIGTLTVHAGPTNCQPGVITMGGFDACLIGNIHATQVSVSYVDAAGNPIASSTQPLPASGATLTFPGASGVWLIYIVGVEAGGSPAYVALDDIAFDDSRVVPTLLATQPACGTQGVGVFGWRDATPSGPVRVVASPSLGSGGVVPAGPCAGTPLPLSPTGMVAPPWGMGTSGAAGKGYVYQVLPPVACGGWAVVVDETTCRVSAPDRIE